MQSVYNHVLSLVLFCRSSLSSITLILLKIENLGDCWVIGIWKGILSGRAEITVNDPELRAMQTKVNLSFLGMFLLAMLLPKGWVTKSFSALFVLLAKTVVHILCNLGCRSDSLLPMHDPRSNHKNPRRILTVVQKHLTVQLTKENRKVREWKSEGNADTNLWESQSINQIIRYLQK